MEAGAQIFLVTGIRGSFPLRPIFLLQYREGLKPAGNNVNADRLIEVCPLDQVTHVGLWFGLFGGPRRALERTH